MDEKKLPGDAPASAAPAAATSQEEEQQIDTSEIDSEVDQHIANAPADLTGEDDEEDDDTVRVKKSDLQKFNDGKKNLLEGLKTVKTKVKGLKPKTPVKKEETPAPKSSEEPVLTRKEFYRGNEKAAIKVATQNKLLEDNWADIMGHFSRKRTYDTPEDALADIEDAFVVWQHHNPDKVKDAKPEERKILRTQIGTETSLPAGDSSQGGGQQAKKSIMPKSTPASQWYPQPAESK